MCILLSRIVIVFIMHNHFKKRSFSSHQAGQGIVEFGLIMVLVALLIILPLALLGSALSNSYKKVVDLFQGQSTQQIMGDMKARMLSFYIAHGRWPRTFSPYNFTDIGLNPSDWSQPINGLYFSPHGSEVGISNKSGDSIEVYAKDLNGLTLHLINGWSIWCPVNNTYCYYHTIAPGNEVIPDSIYATGY
jgi:Flp pilus assembly pilin Flp